MMTTMAALPDDPTPLPPPPDFSSAAWYSRTQTPPSFNSSTWGSSFARTPPPPPQRPSCLDLAETALRLQPPAQVQVFGKLVLPRLDLGASDLLAHNLVAIKGIRRTRQPEPMLPNRAEITASRQRIATGNGAINYLRRTGEAILVASSGTDLLLIAFPTRTVLPSAGIESRRFRAYLRLEAYGDMVAALVPGIYDLEFGFWYNMAALRIRGALSAPQPLDRLFTGLIWQPAGGSGATAASAATPVDWQPARASEIAAHSCGTVSYIGDAEPMVASMRSPWMPHRSSFRMCELRPSGITLHPDVDAELGHPPGLALCISKDWATVHGPSDFVLVASANPAVAYGIDRSLTRNPHPLLRLDGRAGWLQRCLRFGPRNGDITYADGLLSLRLAQAVRPHLDLEEPHRIAFPAGSPQPRHRGKVTLFPNGSRDPFCPRGTDEAWRTYSG